MLAPFVFCFFLFISSLDMLLGVEPAVSQLHVLYYHLHCMACSVRPAWCVLGTWPPLIPLLRPLFVLGALATSDQRINPGLCILNVRSTLWDLWNGFDSGLMLEPAQALLSVTAQHKHLLIWKRWERAPTQLLHFRRKKNTLSLENLLLLFLISGTINEP